MAKCLVLLVLCSVASGRLQPPQFRTLFQWKQIDYDFATEAERQAAVRNGNYIPINVIPLGVERWRERVFVSTPRWKRGVPATLSSLHLRRADQADVSPKLKPYPDWAMHIAGNCSGLTSVFRMAVDSCGRMWVLDSGQVEAFETPRQICPPQLIVFNLSNDKLLGRYPIPPEFVLQNSLITNIIVDTRDKNCNDLHVYMADAWRYGLIVFRASDAKFWKFSHHTFYPDPLLSNYTLHGVNYQWMDGLFGMSLSQKEGDRTLFYHSMSSSLEFYVKTSVIRNERRVNDSVNEFHLLGESRGRIGQVSAAAVDRNGVMFFNLISQDSIGCWDIRKPYTINNLGVVARDTESLVFPNDLRIDHEQSQRGWLITNRLPMYQFQLIRPEDVNYRLIYFDTSIAENSICDPKIPATYTDGPKLCYDV